MPSRTLRVIAGCALALGVVVRAADPVRSQWASQPIAIDGRLEEWGNLTFVEEGVTVAAVNDNDSLGLAVSTTDPATRMGLARGLVVWFAPANKQTTDFGLQWPATVAAEGGSNGRPLDPAVLTDVDILGPGKARRLVTLTPALGVQAASGTVLDRLAFELRLPLVTSATHPHAVGVPAGRAFRLGLFTPELPKTRDDAEAPVAHSGVYGMGPIMGGPGTGIPLPDSSRKPRDEVRPRTLKIWTTVQLAAPPR